MTDIVNARDDFGATGDGTTNDTAALQAAINACFGSPSSPNGTSYWLNKKLFIPNGRYKTTAPLLVTKLQGGKIYGSGRFATTIENVTGGATTGAVFRTNGMGYSSISDMQLICHTGGQCLDLDYDGTGGGAALQANTIENIFCLGSYEEGTIGVRIGQSGFMGSECIFEMLHTQGCMTAGTLINNFNALQHQFYGGQDQHCGIGIWVTVGSSPIINGRGFQQQVDCDIKTSGAYQNAMSVVGCRTESANFILNDGGQALDVSACVQTCPTTPGYFVKSAGGFTSIRSCFANGKVSPNYWCNLVLETSQLGFETEPSQMWWVPNNTVAANIFIRNSRITEGGVLTHILDQRRFTKDGLSITTIDNALQIGQPNPPGATNMVATYVPGPNGPTVLTSTAGGGPTTVFNVSLAAGTAEAGWADYTIVILIGAGNLSAGSGTQIKVSLFFKALDATNTVGGYVGQKAAAGDAYDFSGTQAQLKWSTSTTFVGNGSADQTYVSDWITLGEAYDEAKDYLVAIQLTGISSIDGRYVTHSGDSYYYKAGADAATTNKSGYTLDAANTLSFVTKLEVQ